MESAEQVLVALCSLGFLPLVQTFDHAPPPPVKNVCTCIPIHIHLYIYELDTFTSEIFSSCTLKDHLEHCLGCLHPTLETAALETTALLTLIQQIVSMGLNLHCCGS